MAELSASDTDVNEPGGQELLDAALDALQRLAAEHARLRHARDVAASERRTLTHEIVQSIHYQRPELFRVEDPDEDEFDDPLDLRIQDCRSYIAGDTALLEERPELRAALDAARQVHAPNFARIDADADRVAAYVAAAQENVKVALGHWASYVKASKDTWGWPLVLRSWRDALRLTTRNAATVLGVSAAAVTRYETGKRAPSAPQLLGLIEAISDADPTALGTYEVMHAFAAGLGTSSDEILAMIGDRDAEQIELEAALSDIIEQRKLKVDQLRFLVRLAQNPKALDSLAAFVASDAVTAIRGRQSTNTQGGPR